MLSIEHHKKPDPALSQKQQLEADFTIPNSRLRTNICPNLSPNLMIPNMTTTVCSTISNTTSIMCTRSGRCGRTMSLNHLQNDI